jgi:hypothetical protein
VAALLAGRNWSSASRSARSILAGAAPRPSPQAHWALPPLPARGCDGLVHVTERLAGRGMSGQRLDIGEHGDIYYCAKASGRVAASAYFRNPQGVRRRLESTGDSKTAARRLLIKKLEGAISAGGAGYSSSMAKPCRSVAVGVCGFASAATS